MPAENVSEGGAAPEQAADVQAPAASPAAQTQSVAEEIEALGAQTTGHEESILGESLLGDALFEPIDFHFDFDLDTDLSGIGTTDEAGSGNEAGKTSTERFNWNIHTFPGQEVHKTEDIDFNWSLTDDEETPQVTEPAAPAAPEPSIPVREPATTVSGSAAAAPETAAPVGDDLFSGLEMKTDEARKQSEEIDRFFTFHKKNEEFQKLLDQEYEKIKSGNILTEEMTTATAASEERFVSHQPADPMEELFASEGVVKPYEPKPVQTDVLERIEAADAEKKAREEAKKRIEEQRARAEAEWAEQTKTEATAETEAQEAEAAIPASQAVEAATGEKVEAETGAKAEAEVQETEAASQVPEEAAGDKAAAEAEPEAEAQEETQETEAARQAAEAAARQAAEEAVREKARAEARAEEEAVTRAAEERAERIRQEAEAKLAEQEARLRAEEEARARAEAQASAAQQAQQAQQAAAKQDPLNHISEMERARETFFGGESEAIAAEQPDETIPEKTKAVDKAAILAGMATASQMVQRDRAAAARAAEIGQGIPEKTQASSVELPDFLGHMDEMTEPETADEPETAGQLGAEAESETLIEDTAVTGETAAAEDTTEIEELFFDDLAADLQEQEIPQEILEDVQTEENQEELFSLDDLLDQEPVDQETMEIPAGEISDMANGVSGETLIINEDSVADILQRANTDQPLEETMIFRAGLTGDSEGTPAPQEQEDLYGGAVDASEALAEELQEEEEEEFGGKGRIALKICLVVLIILLAMEIAGVVLKLAAPNSGATRFINEQITKVLSLVTGDEDTEYYLAAPEKIRTAPVEDKTALIKAELGKNKDGNLQTIVYDAGLQFDAAKDYEDKDIALTQNLAEVAWYKDAADRQVYYDQAIVGNMIAYESQRTNMLTHNDPSVLSLIKADTDLYAETKELGQDDAQEPVRGLAIGQIRQAGTVFYVWVAEKTDNSQDSAAAEKVYKLEAEGNAMKIVAACEA